MLLSILISLAAFFWLLIILRRDRLSLGIPVAYLFALLFIHLPGAFAHLVDQGILLDTKYTEIGIRFTAIASVCFVVGVRLALYGIKRPIVPNRGLANRTDFWVFCVVAGWFVIYGLSFLSGIPSIGAAIEKGGGIWMLGVLLGLRYAFRKRDLIGIAKWGSAMAVYPVLMLVLGGFISFGSTAVFIVLSGLTISMRSVWRTMILACLVSFLFLNLFLSYYENRTNIRNAVWGEAGMNSRIDASLGIFRDFKVINPANSDHLRHLDQRLNQNYFVGLAASRIESGQAQFQNGKTLWDGVISLVPRIIWPDKPVYGGSPGIIEEMTGFIVAEGSSYGAGNVMEFHINFGIPSLIIGFLVLGWLFGYLDRKAAMAEAKGDLGEAIVFFLPASAMIHPNGSLIELMGGGAAALVAAIGWKAVWISLSQKYQNNEHGSE